MYDDTGGFADDTTAVNVGRNGDPKELDAGTEEFTCRRDVEKGR
jgi:hypothetical protein